MTLALMARFRMLITSAVSARLKKPTGPIEGRIADAGARQSDGHLKPSVSRIRTSPRFATNAVGQNRYADELVRPHPCLRLTEAIWCVVISGAVIRV
jgi:hypothetical protein